MNRGLGYLVLLIATTFVQCASQVHKKSHVPALCYRCQCLDLETFTADCRYLEFKEVPEIWKDLKVEWSYQLQGNKISSVPVFPHLENLTSISVAFNRISKIADGAFENITNLKELDFTFNNLESSSFSPDAFRGPFRDFTSPIQTLNLSHNALEDLPNSAFRYLKNLTLLDLSQNFFNELLPSAAKSLQELPNLRILKLSGMKLKSLPEQLFVDLRNLEELDLSANKFVVVPQAINSAESLKTLYLNNNSFTVISDDSFTRSLRHLKSLYLTGCPFLFRITDEAFGNLVSLDFLWLNDNPRLRDLYSYAFYNPINKTPIRLKEVHLENNKLQHLSQHSLNWEEIDILKLDGNPWNCDCNMKWLIKTVLPRRLKMTEDLADIRCALPLELTGKKITDKAVQDYDFVCESYDVPGVQKYSYSVITAIVVVSLLLATGAVVLSCMLYKRAQAQDWVGNMVKYRKTFNEEEEMITSNIHYEDLPHDQVNEA